MTGERTSGRYQPPMHELTLSGTDIKRLQKGREVRWVAGDGEEYVLRRKMTKMRLREQEDR